MGFRHHLRTAVLCSVAVFLSLFLDHYFFNQDRGRDQPTRSHPIANRDLLSQDVLPKNITSWHNHQALQRRQDSAWQTAVNKGDDLICLMRGTVEEAQKMVANSPKWAGKSVQSLFVDHTEMEKWGWEFVKTGQKPVDDFFDGHQLKETLSSLGLSSKLEHWSQESVEHWHDWNYKGKSGPALVIERNTPNAHSISDFTMYFNGMGDDQSEPAIIRTSAYAPVPRVKEFGDDGPIDPNTTPPDLQQFSDINFLAYYRYVQKHWAAPKYKGGSVLPVPKHIIGTFIDNQATKDILDQVFHNLGHDPVGAPGTDIDLASENGRAILGSPNAATVCFLLLQHKKQFGINTVTGIRVWMDDDEHWNMYYKIGVLDGKADAMVGKRGAEGARL